MKKLYEIFGQKLLKGDVGIEIEVEGDNLPDDVDRRWKADVDGSLRGNNREYILKQPIAADDCENALTALKGNLDKNGAKLRFSFRTSVHIHVNVQELTYVQYLNFLYTYFLLEEPLMTYCGKERKGNRFCLRLQDAEGMLDTYHRLFKEGQQAIHNIPRDQVRYSAMNIEATVKYGSLEFRGMRGNLDIDVLNRWIQALVCIREFAKSVESPIDVYDLYGKEEPIGFLQHVMGGLADGFYYPRLVKDVQRSFSLSLDLPFSYVKPVEPKPFDPKEYITIPGRELEDVESGEWKRKAKTALAHCAGNNILPAYYMNPLPISPEGKMWMRVAGGDHKLVNIEQPRAARPVKARMPVGVDGEGNFIFEDDE